MFEPSNPNQKIRNFCIIAHIDHGKSTLADRFLELTKTINQRDMQEQVLDQMDLERERGITIKLQPVRMDYQGYTLNLIDTPGHVDFTYEVSRSLACVEGALLVVDATQGIQAQTVGNLFLAMEQNLEIIPVLNKIDLPAADVPGTIKQIQNLIGCPPEEIISVSAKTGQNVDQLLSEVIKRIPPPAICPNPTRALIFDSVFNDYRGVIAYVRVFEGQIKPGDQVRFMASGLELEVLEVGYFKPKMVSQARLITGEIGYVVTGLKAIDNCRVGDTLTTLNNSATIAWPGYREVKPMVFAGLFCKEGNEFEKLREGLGKLKLTDAALTYEPERSVALGFGFRAGFLGLLHLDIIQERLKREFNLDLMVTTPSVAYKVKLTKGTEQIITCPYELPEKTKILQILEPIMITDIITPQAYLGNVMELVKSRRGVPRGKEIEYLDETRVLLHYQMPLSQIITDFYDCLKNVSSGYASLNYDFLEYQTCQVERMDILVAQDLIEALALIIYKDEAYKVGKKIVAALKDVLPRQMFEVKIQAALGAKIIASERIPAMRKDVTAKLYGGDVTRKRKLLEKQKAGKKRMKSMGRVDIPPEAFLAVLKR